MLVLDWMGTTLLIDSLRTCATFLSIRDFDPIQTPPNFVKADVQYSEIYYSMIWHSRFKSSLFPPEFVINHLISGTQ